MGDFIVRVQLSRENDANYISLKEKLITAGYTKKVISAGGKEYLLPNGNYRIESDLEPLAILTIVEDITKTIDDDPMIIVTAVKEKGMAWSGLLQPNVQF